MKGVSDTFTRGTDVVPAVRRINNNGNKGRLHKPNCRAAPLTAHPQGFSRLL